MPTDVGILSIALKAFLTEFLSGYSRIHGSAQHLLHLLGLLDLILAGIFLLWSRNEDNWAWLAQKALAYGFWIFVVAQWITLAPTVINGFVWVGLQAGGGRLSVADFTNPSAIAGLGMVATEPIWAHVRDYGWNFWKHTLDILFCSFWGLVILISFFAIAIEVFLFFLTFYVFAVLSIILLPFGVNRTTSWIADNCFSTLLAWGVKVMVLAMVTSAVFPLIQRFVVQPNPTWAQLVGMAVGMVALALLCWHAPQKAVGMFTQGPQLSAGVFAASMVGAAVVMGAAGGMAVRGTRMAARLVPKRSGSNTGGGAKPPTP
jgi:type IV secretion system protein TrbL